MKIRIISVILVLIISVTVCAGCTGKSDYAGVYESAYGTRIVLFEDGTCKHLDDDAKWKVRSGNLTITRQLPDKYYLDVYVNEEVQEMFAVCTQLLGGYLLMMNNIDDSNIDKMEYFESDGMLRIKLKEKDKDDVLRNALSVAEGVEKVEDYIEKGSTRKYEYKVAGNSIMTEVGDYIKKS